MLLNGGVIIDFLSYMGLQIYDRKIKELINNNAYFVEQEWLDNLK